MLPVRVPTSLELLKCSNAFDCQGLAGYETPEETEAREPLLVDVQNGLNTVRRQNQLCWKNVRDKGATLGVKGVESDNVATKFRHLLLRNSARDIVAVEVIVEVDTIIAPAEFTKQPVRVVIEGVIRKVGQRKTRYQGYWYLHVALNGGRVEGGSNGTGLAENVRLQS